MRKPKAFKMVKHHAGQNHRNRKLGGHGKNKSGGGIIKTAHTGKGRRKK